MAAVQDVAYIIWVKVFVSFVMDRSIFLNGEDQQNMKNSKIFKNTMFVSGPTINRRRSPGPLLASQPVTSRRLRASRVTLHICLRTDRPVLSLISRTKTHTCKLPTINIRAYCTFSAQQVVIHACGWCSARETSANRELWFDTFLMGYYLSAILLRSI